MALRILGISLVFCLVCSCKTKQAFTPETYQGKMITFGTEGGFAGLTSENYIFENGQILHFESRRGTTQEFGKIDKDVTNQIFSNYEALNLADFNLNDPGNLSYFIKMKEGENEKVIKWGGMNEETPPIVEQYFRTLGQIAKKYKIITE